MAAPQRLFFWARWLHLYLSTLLFATFAFLCFTGVLLNHEWSLGERPEPERVRLALPAALAEALLPSDPWSPPLDAVRRAVERQAGLREPARIELYEDVHELVLEYRSPSGRAVAVVSAAGVELERRREPGLALLAELHRGREAGAVWRGFLDVSAGAMLVFAITGLCLLFQNRRRRAAALLCVLSGLVTPVLLYLVWVPRPV